MALNLNIPDDKLPAAIQARCAVLAAKAGRPGPVADTITRKAGLPTYTEARQVLAELLGLVDLLAANCADRVDAAHDQRIANARRVTSA